VSATLAGTTGLWDDGWGGRMWESGRV
jgi:hypothetical protein